MPLHSEDCTPPPDDVVAEGRDEVVSALKNALCARLTITAKKSFGSREAKGGQNGGALFTRLDDKNA